MQELRQTLAAMPEAAQWGDLADLAERSWLELIAGEDLFYREALKCKLTELL